MSKRTTNVLLTAIAATAAGLLAPAAALAQQQPQPPRGPQTAAGRAPGGQQPTRAAPDPRENETAAAYQRSGGSLAMASLAASMPPSAPNGPNGPGGGPAAPAAAPPEFNFYAVPEPVAKTIVKHNLVTVIVREESSFSSSGTTETKRQSDIDAQLEEFVKLKLGNFAVQGGAQGLTPPAIKATASRNFKGEGTADRTDSMTARMTAEIVDVKPNGTLVLQARKTIKTDDEEQSFVLTGTARVEDVVADNTVLSTQLYDLRLEKSTKGSVRDGTRKGLLGKLLDLLNPF